VQRRHCGGRRVLTCGAADEASARLFWALSGPVLRRRRGLSVAVHVVEARRVEATHMSRRPRVQ